MLWTDSWKLTRTLLMPTHRCTVACQICAAQRMMDGTLAERDATPNLWASGPGNWPHPVKAYFPPF